MSKGKKIELVFIVMVIVIGSIIGSITIITKANNNRYLESIDLGKKYVLEGRYEEAILEFEKALSINDKNPEAEEYIKVVNTYVEMEQAYKNGDYDKVLELSEKLNGMNNSNLFEEKVTDINKDVEEKKNIMSEIDALESKVDELIATNSFNEALNMINQYKTKDINEEYKNKLNGLEKKVTEAKTKYEEEQTRLEEERKAEEARRAEEERKRREEAKKANELTIEETTKLLKNEYPNDSFIYVGGEGQFISSTEAPITSFRSDDLKNNGYSGYLYFWSTPYGSGEMIFIDKKSRKVYSYYPASIFDSGGNWLNYIYSL